MDKIYDIVILGGGPAGMTASIYAKRAGLDVVVIEKTMPGGAVCNTAEVSNFPGFKTISGIDLATKMFEHTQQLDIPFVFDEVKKIRLESDIKVVECFTETLKAYAVILAYGASVRKLGIEREKEYIGKGVSYCATCDGALYKGETVALVGGGNTALEDAIYLSNIAKKVYLIHRRDEFRGEKVLQDEVFRKNNIELVLNSAVKNIIGEKKIEKIEVENLVSHKTTSLAVGGLFVCIGRGPDTEILDFEIKKDAQGYIVTDQNMKTSIDGVYAVGDIRTTPLRQIITACADGSIASTKSSEYIRNIKKK